MTIPELRAKSLDIANKARELLNTITDENRSEKEAEFDRMMADSDDLALRAAREEKIEERNREFGVVETVIPETSVTVEGRADVIEDRAAIYDAYLRGDVDARELRAANVATGTQGGYLVPTTLEAKLISAMKAYGPLNDGGPVTYQSTASGNPLVFPTNDDTANAGALIAEGAEASEDTLTFGTISLNAYKFTSKVFLVSNELIQDSAIDIGQVVTSKMAERMGRAFNATFTNGTGSAQPQGIVTGASVGKTAASATAIAADELMDLQHSVDPAYRANAAFMFSDPILLVVRKLKDGQGNYIWNPSYSLGQPDTLLNRPYYINQDMQQTIATGKRTVLFGDFSQYTVRRVRDFSIRRMDEKYATSDQVGFVGFARADARVMVPAAIKALVQA